MFLQAHGSLHLTTTRSVWFKSILSGTSAHDPCNEILPSRDRQPHGAQSSFELRHCERAVDPELVIVHRRRPASRPNALRRCWWAPLVRVVATAVPAGCFWQFLQGLFLEFIAGQSPPLMTSSSGSGFGTGSVARRAPPTAPPPPPRSVASVPTSTASAHRAGSGEDLAERWVVRLLLDLEPTNLMRRCHVMST